MDLTITTIGNKFDFVSFYSPLPTMTTPAALKKFIFVEDVPTLVAKVRAATEGFKIARLLILGHGCPGTQRVASGNNFEGHEREYIRLNFLRMQTLNVSSETHLPFLRNLFAKNGRIEFHGCEVGAGQGGKIFLQRVSTILGVPAFAGVDPQLLHPGYEGKLITANGQQITEFEPSLFQ